MYEDDPQDRVFDLLGEGDLRLAPAGAPGDRQRRGRRRGHARAAARPSTPTRYVPANDRDRGRRLARARAAASSWRAASSRAPRALRRRRRRRRRRRSRRRRRRARVRFLEKDTEQYHVCIGGARDRARRRAPLRAARARRRARRHVLLAPVPGGARAPRPGLLGLHLLEPVSRTAARSACTSARARRTCARRSRCVAEELARCVEDPASAEELERSRENLKGRMVLALESTGARMGRLGASLLGDLPILSVDELIERHRRGHASRTCAASRASCSRPARCRWPPSGPTRPSCAARSRRCSTAPSAARCTLSGTARGRLAAMIRVAVAGAAGRMGRRSAPRSRGRRTWSSSAAPTRCSGVAARRRARRRRRRRRLHAPRHGARERARLPARPACTS